MKDAAQALASSFVTGIGAFAAHSPTQCRDIKAECGNGPTSDEAEYVLKFCPQNRWIMMHGATSSPMVSMRNLCRSRMLPHGERSCCSLVLDGRAWM